MVKKLTRHGNSLALVIDRPVLDLLKIDANTPIEITTDGEMLVLAPVRDEQRRKQFEAAVAEGNRQYGRTLKKLAE